MDGKRACKWWRLQWLQTETNTYKIEGGEGGKSDSAKKIIKKEKKKATKEK